MSPRASIQYLFGKAAGLVTKLVKQLTFTRVLACIVLVPSLFYLVREGIKLTVVVDEISVPKKLEELGFTADVMSRRIVTDILQMEARSHSRIAQQSLASTGPPSPEDSIAAEVEVPGTKFSLKSVLELARNILGHPPIHVSGDIVIGPTDSGELSPGEFQATATVRVLERDRPARTDSVVVTTDSVEVLAHRTAELALALLNPYPLAVYREQQGDFDSAESLIGAVLDDPNADKVHQEAAHILWGLALADQSKFELAAQHYQEALKLFPRDPAIYNNWGALLASQQEFNEAREKLKLALALNRADPFAHNNLGALLYFQGENDAAIAEFKAATGYDRCFVFAYNNLGRLFAGMQMFSDAAEDFRKSAQCDPTSSETYTAWAVMETRQGHYEVAEALWRRAIQVDPASVSGYTGLAELLIRLNRYQDAEPLVRRAARLVPASGAMRLRWAEVLYRTGAFPSAIARYREALERDEFSFDGHLGLGRALRAVGECTAALAEYSAARGINPSVAAAYSELGAVLFVERKYSDAMLMYREALHRDARSVEVLVGLGRLLAIQRQYREAEAAIREAITLRPADPSLYRELAVIFRKEGKSQKATAALSRLQALIGVGIDVSATDGGGREPLCKR
jgi:tetratricopeptide (TPR) repeat protein